MHYARWKKFGDPLTKLIADKGTSINANGYRIIDGRGEHIAIAERALGMRLPTGVIVHHVNEVRSDNRNENLVICTRAYHMLIHQRIDAFKSSGNADWRKCSFCKQYDEPKNLYIAPCNTTPYHKSCRLQFHRENRK